MWKIQDPDKQGQSTAVDKIASALWIQFTIMLKQRQMLVLNLPSIDSRLNSSESLGNLGWRALEVSIRTHRITAEGQRSILSS